MRQWLTLLALALASCGSQGLQSRKHYEEALANSSTSPSLVRIALDHAGKSQVTCVYVSSLIQAIIVERGFTGDESLKQAYAVARGNHTQRFSFGKADAVRELGLAYDVPQRQQACKIIASGKAAFRSDYSGEIMGRK
jgi:hypothetical protein